MASLLKFGEKHFFLEAHPGIFQWPDFFFFSKLVVASTFEDEIVIVPLNRTFS